MTKEDQAKAVLNSLYGEMKGKAQGMKIIINNKGGYKIVTYENIIAVSERQRDNWKQTITMCATSPVTVKGWAGR
jgi:hypothetical protein